MTLLELTTLLLILLAALLFYDLARFICTCCLCWVGEMITEHGLGLFGGSYTSSWFSRS